MTETDFESSVPVQDPPGRQAAVDWLLGRINYERFAVIPYHEQQLKLDRMRDLLDRLGRPDAALKIIHVAGTKGKGSASAMIAGILAAAGLRTGVFSSPHLERIEERFAVDGQPCSAAEFVALLDRIRPVVKAMDEEAALAGEPAGGPTFFDITTAVALLHFVERGADAAVLEVGLGGRLDSTNVCQPVVSVITSISFDHMKQLGNTLAAIAGEKAGIIKSGVPIVSGVLEPEAQQVIARVARERVSQLIQLGRDFEFAYAKGARSQEPGTRGEEPVVRSQDSGARASSNDSWLPTPGSSGSTIDFRSLTAESASNLSGLSLAQRGAHQAANAAVALATVEELRRQGWNILEEAIRSGLAHTVLPGRVEFIPGPPAAVLDVAHNPASARALVETLSEFPPTGRRTLLMSVSADKDVRAIVRALVPHFERFVITQYRENPRSVAADKLATIVREELEKSDATDSASANKRDTGKARGTQRESELIVCPTPAEAWQEASRSAQPGELICITGSFFLIAEMRPLVLNYKTSTP